jgi:hypothetical protein
MVNHGECPKCRKRLLHVNIENVVGLIDGESKARCLSLSCMHCKTVLAVSIDARAKPRSKSSRAAAKPTVG